jgi:hypothetical protein
MALRRQGKEGSLPSLGAGNWATEEDLKKYFDWAIQHYFPLRRDSASVAKTKSFREIARENGGVHFTTVEDQVEFIVDHLPAPHLLAGPRKEKASKTATQNFCFSKPPEG